MENYTYSTGLNASAAVQSYQYIRKLVAMDSYPEHFYFILVGVVGSIVCFIGLLGNILNMLIFGLMLRHHTPARATKIFLLTMSVVDFFILVIYLMYDMSCIVTPLRPLLDVNSFTMKQIGSFSYYVYYTWYMPTNILMLTSNWLTVSVMVFRFIAVYFPIKARGWCGSNRAKVVLSLVLTLATLSVVPDFFTIQLIHMENIGYVFGDTELYDNETFHSIYYTYLYLINCIIPFTICLLLSVVLLRALRRRDSSFQKESIATHNPKRMKEQKKISVMLLGIVLCYIICTIPSLVWRALKPAAKEGTGNITQQLWMQLRAVADICLIIQHSINFIIYIATNQKYRQYLRLLLLNPKDCGRNQFIHHPQSLTTRSFRQRCSTGTSLLRSQLKSRTDEAPIEISEGGVKSDNQHKIGLDIMESSPLLHREAIKTPP